MQADVTTEPAGLTSTREAFTNRLHFRVALVCAWLILTSPWVGMLRGIPRDPGFFDLAHIAVGAAGLLLAIVYTYACTRRGRWRLYFPWSPAGLRIVGRDIAGLFRGRIPAAEGGGLFAFIEGLLLILLLVTALTGAGWALAQGSHAALTWREVHIVAAQVLTGLIIAHVVAVATHLRDLV
jgi:hypothetical protein